MWGCAENNDTKQAKVNSFKVKYNGKIKNSQLYPGISNFTTNLNIPDVSPSNTASLGHPWKSYLTPQFSIGIHTSYGQYTSIN